MKSNVKPPRRSTIVRATSKHPCRPATQKKTALPGCTNGPLKGRNKKKEQKARLARKAANERRAMRIYLEVRRREKELLELELRLAYPEVDTAVLSVA